MAAAVAFVGSAMILKAGGALPQLAGGRTTSDQPVLVLSIVILLAATGLLLAVMAGRELLSLRRGSHRR